MESGVAVLLDLWYSSSYSSNSADVFPSRLLMRTSRRMRTRHPCSATVRLSDVLSASPGNFLALKTVKAADFTSKRQSKEPFGVAAIGGGFELSLDCSASASLESLVSSYRLKLNLYFPSWRTERSGKMKYPASAGRSKYAIPDTGMPVRTGTC